MGMSDTHRAHPGRHEDGPEHVVQLCRHPGRGHHGHQAVAAMPAWCYCKSCIVRDSGFEAGVTCLQTIKAEGIECGWKRVDGYLFPTSSDQTAFNKLDGEMSAYVRAGQSDVRKVRHSLETPPLNPSSAHKASEHWQGQALLRLLLILEAGAVLRRLPTTDPSPTPYLIECWSVQVALDGNPALGGIKETFLPLDIAEVQLLADLGLTLI